MHVCAVLNCAQRAGCVMNIQAGYQKTSRNKFSDFLILQLRSVKLFFLSVGPRSFLPLSICRVQTWPGEARTQLPMAHHCSVYMCTHMHEIIGPYAPEELVYCWMNKCVKSKMSALIVRMLWVGESETLPSLEDLTDNACGWLRLSWLKAS